MSMQSFFLNHLELIDFMFKKFDDKLIKEMAVFMMQGLTDSAFEFHAESCECVNVFNEFIFEKLQRKSKI